MGQVIIHGNLLHISWFYQELIIVVLLTLGFTIGAVLTTVNQLAFDV